MLFLNMTCGEIKICGKHSTGFAVVEVFDVEGKNLSSDPCNCHVKILYWLHPSFALIE